MLKPLPDMLLDAQAETLREPKIKPLYECSICGDFECESVREISFYDCGELVHWEVCPKHSWEEVRDLMP